MKYLLFLGLICLVGCESRSTYNVRVGDKVILQRGFYKGCRGIVVGYNDSLAIYENTITLVNVRCGNSVKIDELTVLAKSLKK